MGNVTVWIKEHPYVVGIGVFVVGLLFILFRSGTNTSAGSSGTSSLDVQVAGLQAAADVQGAQIQSAQNIAAIQAGAATSQVQGAVDVAQIQGNTAVAETQAQVAGDVAKAGIQGQIYSSLISSGLQESLATTALQTKALDAQKTLADNAINLSKQGGRGDIGANELALVLNQGNIGSYNQGTSAASIASTISTASILKSVLNTGGSIASGLF